jgi:hypothetical protein
MSLFKSKAQRRMERDLEIRKGLQAIRRNINTLDKNIRQYREKAVRARQIEAQDQLAVLRDAIRRSMAQIRMQERQLLAMETAMQMKNQAESMQQFATSMQAVSRSIAEAFGGTDMESTLANYEKAMMQAQDMEERMNLFLDLSADVMGTEGTSEELVSLEEIDRLIEEDLQAAEANRLDARIDAVLERAGRQPTV